MLRTVVLYGPEAWTLTKKEYRLGIWERKILRKIYVAVCEEGNWRIRKNAEVSLLYNNLDLITKAKGEDCNGCGTLRE